MNTFNFRDGLFGLKQLSPRIVPILSILIGVHILTQPQLIKLQVQSIELAKRHTELGSSLYLVRTIEEDGKTMLILEEQVASTHYLWLFWIVLIFAIAYAFIDPGGKFAQGRIENKKSENA